MNIPETTNYLMLGLGSIFVLVIGYIASLIVRYQNLQKDRELIERLAEDDAS